MENGQNIWNELTLESAEFIFMEAEKRLQATIENAKSLTDRAVTMMQFSIPLSLVMMGLIIEETKRELLVFYCITLVILIVISLMALYVYEMYSIQPPGHPPHNFLDEDTTHQKNDQQYFKLLLSTLQDSQRMIESNEAIYRGRLRVFFWAMVLVKILISSSFFYIAMDSLVRGR